MQAAQASRSIAQSGQHVQPIAIQSLAHTPLYSADNPLEVISREEKVALLKKIDAATRASRFPSVPSDGEFNWLLGADFSGDLGRAFSC